jgi:hypothetical protein
MIFIQWINGSLKLTIIFQLGDCLSLLISEVFRLLNLILYFSSTMNKNQICEMKKIVQRFEKIIR